MNNFLTIIDGLRIELEDICDENSDMGGLFRAIKLFLCRVIKVNFKKY
jgi:hypothetical protein